MTKVFIDLGANRGQSLEVFSRKWQDWHEYQIHSFEADSRNIPKLLEKVAQLKQRAPSPVTIHVHSTAAWICTGTIPFYQSEEPTMVGSSLIKEKRTGRLSRTPVNVPCEDVAELLKTWSTCVSRKIILKIDVEGAEYRLLEHLLETDALGLVDTVYVEFHNTKVGKTKQDDANLLHTLRTKYPALTIISDSYHDLEFT